MTTPGASASAARTAALILSATACGPAVAATAAEVTHLSGTLAVLKADGRMRILAQRSAVEAGDTLSTEKDSYARLRFSDGGVVTLRPRTRFRVESYAFDAGKPAADGYAVALLKGGLRALSGLIGKRGNRDAWVLRTPTATVGIRGTDLGALTCENDCPKLENGTYTRTYDGIIRLANSRGGIECVPGEVCYAGPDGAPHKLTADPGVDFEPAGFDMNVGNPLQGASGGECTFR